MSSYKLFLGYVIALSIGLSCVNSSRNKKDFSTEDLIEVADASFVEYSIAVGGDAALDMQKKLTRYWPLEVKTKVTAIPFRLIPYSASVESINKNSGFYMSKYEVTKNQWLAVMGADYISMDTGETPAGPISYMDAIEFLDRLCEIEGVSLGTYRLPTEDEWIFAAKAGVETSTYVGDSSENIFDEAVDLIAWYYWNTSPELIPLKWERHQQELCEQSFLFRGIEIEPPNINSRVRAVGLKLPNVFGLYDMLGNVAEYVSLQCDNDAKEYASVYGGRVYSYAKDISWSENFSVGLTQRGGTVGIRIVRNFPIELEEPGSSSRGGSQEVKHPPLP